jgi:hypothetical protein
LSVQGHHCFTCSTDDVPEFVLQLTAGGVSPHGKGLGSLRASHHTERRNLCTTSRALGNRPDCAGQDRSKPLGRPEIREKRRTLSMEKNSVQVGPAAVSSTRAEGMRIKRCFDDGPMLF